MLVRHSKNYLFCLLGFVFCLNGNAAAIVDYYSDENVPRYTKSIIVDRLESIEHSIDLTFNDEVKKYIKSYASRGKRGTEYIIGRSSIYFPIFEHYLKQYGLPEDLKYLPIVESALKSNATSPVGAGGLWQFMIPTARDYDLEINDYIDERYDIHKSSEAAARMLSDLYKRFGDWSLVLAAYNCGLGNVRKAIKKSGETDFGKIKKYLPKETQNYVPKFTAVVYIMNYYHFYDIRPKYPDYNLQMTAVTKVFKRHSFKQLAAQSGVSVETIRLLNPSFTKEVIPPNAKGYNLVLPRLGLSPTFEDELLSVDAKGGTREVNKF